MWPRALKRWDVVYIQTSRYELPSVTSDDIKLVCWIHLETRPNLHLSLISYLCILHVVLKRGGVSVSLTIRGWWPSLQPEARFSPNTSFAVCQWTSCMQVKLMHVSRSNQYSWWFLSLVSQPPTLHFELKRGSVPVSLTIRVVDDRTSNRKPTIIGNTVFDSLCTQPCLRSVWEDQGLFFSSYAPQAPT